MSWHLSNLASQRRNRHKNKEAINESRRKYYKDNKEAINEKRKKNKNRITKIDYEYIKSKYSFCFNKE